MKQCFWNSARMLHPTLYEIYQMVHILMLLWQHARFQSPASLKWNITICDLTGQNTWSYLRHMPVPPSLGLLFSIFNCIFCPAQLQMAIWQLRKLSIRMVTREGCFVMTLIMFWTDTKEQVCSAYRHCSKERYIPCLTFFRFPSEVFGGRVKSCVTLVNVMVLSILGLFLIILAGLSLSVSIQRSF